MALEAESKRFAGEFESLAITGTQPLPTHCHLSSTGESYPLFPTNLTVGDGIHNAIGEIDQDERSTYMDSMFIRVRRCFAREWATYRFASSRTLSTTGG